MATLSDLSSNIADDLARSDLETQITRNIGYAVQKLRREVSHLTEQRGCVLTTAQGQAWYSAVDLSAAEGYEDMTGATVTVSDILGIDYMSLGPTGSGQRICETHHEDFQRLLDSTASSGEPVNFCIYAGRIGLWPTPSATMTVYFTANVRPQVPAAASSSSVYFDEAQELVEAMAAARVCRKVIQDYERAAQFDAIAVSEMQALGWETVKKTTTGRLKAHW